MGRILDSFIEEMKRRKVRIHGAVLMSDGRVVEDIYLGRYTNKTLTRMYSATKSVAALAIGKMVGEGKISLDDKVVDIFRDRFDMSGVHPYMKEQTVRQMLTMTTSLSTPAYSESIRDWLASYFRATPTHPAGTVWNYDSSGSYVIGAMVKHITGFDFVEYLRPVFDAIGVNEDVYSLEGPDGEAWAPSGLMASTEDLARIAYLLVKGGRWQGEQLLPESFVKEAISPLVRNGDGAVVSRFDCGYGYQIWSHPNGAFAFRGLGGQVVVAYPSRDLVFACNSDSASHHNAYDDIFDVVESLIMPAFPETHPELRTDRLIAKSDKTVFESIKGVTYILDENEMGFEKIRFDGEADAMRLYYTRCGEDYSIDFSTDKETEIIFPEMYSGIRLFDEEDKIHYAATTTAEWLQPNKLYITVYAEDLFVGNMTLAFAFRDDVVGIKMAKNAQFFFDGYEGFTAGKVAKE